MENACAGELPRLLVALMVPVNVPAAVGVPDAMQGESIKVFVVKNDPLLTEDDVARYCRENFTGYKVPKYIEFRDEAAAVLDHQRVRPLTRGVGVGNER